MSTTADPFDEAARPTVTRLLGELEQGSRDALDALVPLVYDELLALAHRQRLRWHGDYTLGTTALVHEAYCKLVNQDRLVAENRAHFFGLAARAMRHILCNYARDRRALKRGGDYARVDLDSAGDPADDGARPGDDTGTGSDTEGRLLALHAALSRLEQLHPRRSRVVECRLFGGMTVEDTAAALGISARTVKRDWAAAQEWLREEIEGGKGPDEATTTLDALAADVLPPLMAALVHAAPDALQPGQRVASYEIVAPLGHGGMGVVYRAYDTRLDRHVALKFLPPHHARDAAARTRLADEARAASALDHRNICTIYDIGALDDGRTFLALACYEGSTLRDRIAAGALPVAEAVAIARQVAEGLAAAHRRGIVHRDIKPSNVMLTTDGTVKILDFGIAKVRERDGMQGLTAGTVAYMSPEHARGEPIDARSDLWSLGVVLFEMLTGRRPFAGDTDARTIHAILTQPAPSLPELRDDVPPLLVRVVGKCLEKARDARYPDADALLEALRVAETETGAAYTLYAKGRYYWNKRDSASVQQARTYFEQALDLDPVFAPAWAGLADTFCTLGSYALLPPEDAYPRARAAAERALAIDDELPDAHASLATILADYYWSWAEAAAHYQRAIEQNPGYATARLWYAGLLRDLGSFDAALVQVRAACELDPLAPSVHAAEGITLYLARRYDEAVAVYRRLLEVTPSFHYAHFLMALALVQQGEHAAALRALSAAERWIGADPGVRALTGFLHAAHGRPAEARALLAALEGDPAPTHATAFQRAVIHAALGEAERALVALTQMREMRSKHVRLLRTEPLLDGIRAEPGFQALLDSVGLSDQDVARALKA